MSRIAKAPVELPAGVEVSVDGNNVQVKAARGQLNMAVHPDVEVVHEDGAIKVQPRDERQQTMALTGTMRSLLSNMVEGVTNGFEKRLQLQGVGYRAQSKGKSLDLSLGFSHPVSYPVPEGIEIETPSNTEIVVRGIDKQQVGQVSAEIRKFRPPEPYKGKGVRYQGEQVRRKEAKKK